MDEGFHNAGRNLLLAAFPAEEFEALQQQFTLIAITIRDKVSPAFQTEEYAYFPLSGIFSVIAVTATGVRIEAGLIGREGFVGSSIALYADRAPYEIVTQADGEALRLSRADLTAAMERSPELRAVLLRFVHTFALQASHTALANGRCTIEERLARWLLMCQDRTGSSDVFITHEFLSLMLAVRRSGITDAIHMLEGKRVLHSTRGNLRILNRGALEEIAGSAYGVPEEEYERLIAPLRRAP